MLKLLSAIFTTGFALGAASVAVAIRHGHWRLVPAEPEPDGSTPIDGSPTDRSPAGRSPEENGTPESAAAAGAEPIGS